MKNISKNMSFKGWKLWKFIKGRKKTVIAVIGMACSHFAFNPEMTGLLAGGAVFEGIWSLAEYFFKRIEN